MIFQGFTDTTVNAAALVAKMRTLLKAYKTTNDNERQTGTAPCTVPYMKEMDELFGDSCLVSINHTIKVGTEPQKALAETHVNQSLTELPDYVPSTSLQSQLCVSTQSPPCAVIENSSPRFRKSARERKLELKRKSSEEKEKFHASMKNMMQDLIENRNVQIELEQKK